ncbi:hypothetical protein [Methylomicrobium lacus]|uniref:hypothetical protein n=1 Tax=Methylomicrobium lacus TaxID=136992 RepID=UPI0018E0B37A|nr:hypothetical protein [Methylomicrobium lacus]
MSNAVATAQGRAALLHLLAATARKIAVLFYNTMRFGMNYSDPGADQYEQKYCERVIKQLHCRAAEFGFELHEVGSVS